MRTSGAAEALSLVPFRLSLLDSVILVTTQQHSVMFCHIPFSQKPYKGNTLTLNFIHKSCSFLVYDIYLFFVADWMIKLIYC